MQFRIAIEEARLMSEQDAILSRFCRFWGSAGSLQSLVINHWYQMLKSAKQLMTENSTTPHNGFAL